MEYATLSNPEEANVVLDKIEAFVQKVFKRQKRRGDHEAKILNHNAKLMGNSFRNLPEELQREITSKNKNMKWLIQHSDQGGDRDYVEH